MAFRTSSNSQNQPVFSPSLNIPTGSSTRQNYSLLFQSTQGVQSNLSQQGTDLAGISYIAIASDQTNQISSHVQNQLSSTVKLDPVLQTNSVKNIEACVLENMNQGIAYLQKDAMTQAIRAFEICINVQSEHMLASDETNALLFTFLGKTYQKMGYIDLAIGYWNTGLQFADASPTTLANLYGRLGDAHCMTNEIDIATRAYQFAIRFNPSDTQIDYWSMRLANLYEIQNIGTYNDVIHLIYGVQFNCKVPETRIRLLTNSGTKLLSQSLFLEAKTAFQIALHETGVSAETKAPSAILLAKTCCEEALHILNNIPRSSLSDTSKGNINYLVNLLSGLREQTSPPSSNVLQQRPELATLSHRVTSAKSDPIDALRHQTNQVSFEKPVIELINKGFTYLRSGQLDQAIASFDRGLNTQFSNDPDSETSALLCTFLGIECEKLGYFHVAIEYWTIGVNFGNITPATGASLYGHLGDVYYIIKEVFYAERAYKQAIAINPNDALIDYWNMRLIILSQQIGTDEGAILRLYGIDDASPETKANLLIHSGIKLHSIGLFSEAKTAFQIALQEKGVSAETIARSMILLAETCCEEALNVLNKISRFSLSETRKGNIEYLVSTLSTLRDQIYPPPPELDD